MIDAIKYNLTHLTDFSGRDSRSTFWWYVLFLVILQILLAIAVAIPLAVDAIGQSIEAAQAGANEAEIQSNIIAGMTSDLKSQAFYGVVIAVIMCLLLAAAFVRRLHDAGYPGWIVAIPITAQLFTSIYSYLAIDGMLAAIAEAAANGDAAAVAAATSGAAAYGLVEWIGYLVVIVFGVFKSQDGTNRYGEPPAPIG